MDKEIEFARCKGNFFHFLNYVRVFRPHVGDSDVIAPFEFWPHLLLFFKTYFQNDYLLVDKARQTGLSTAVGILVDWVINFHRGAQVLLTSKDERTASLLLDKIKFVHRHLPEWMACEIDKDSGSQFTLKHQMSGVDSFSGSPYAGEGFTGTLAVADEWDFHEYAEENWHALQPAVSRSGAKFIGISTVNKKRKGTIFQTLCREALKGKSRFKLLFFGWDVVPERDKKWYKNMYETVTEDEMGGLSRDLFMSQNFPATIEESLAPAEAIAVIQPSIISYMRENARTPIEKSGVINYYQRFSPEGAYISSTDPAAGIGKDYTVSLVLNVKSGDVVADICVNNIGIREVTFLTTEMRKEYHNPPWVVEANEYGRRMIEIAHNMGVEKIYRENILKEKWGIEVKEYNREIIWGGAMNAMNDGTLRTPSREGIEQLESLIRNIDKRGRVEAQRGAHDDYPSAMALAWYIRDKAEMYRRISKPFNYIRGK